MTERIDFALEPGVVIFAILFFVLVNLLLAAVLYPYFRDQSPAAEQEPRHAGIPNEEERREEVMAANKPLDDRVDQFREEIHSG